MSSWIFMLIPYALSLVAVGGTFFGIIYSNKVNVALQADRLRSEEATRNREMLRSKGEEIFLLLRQFQDSFHTNITDVTMAMISGTRQPAEVIDLRPSTTTLLKISMLTRVYFPDSIPALDKLEAHRKILESFSEGLVLRGNEKKNKETIGKLLEVTEYVRLHTGHLQEMIVRSLQYLHADVIRSPKC